MDLYVRESEHAKLRLMVNDPENVEVSPDGQDVATQTTLVQPKEAVSGLG